jgi:hypothetical protein
MGMDIGFYIQRHTKEGWVNVFLYKPNNTIAEIWFNGYDVAEYLKEQAYLDVNRADIEKLARDTGWRDNDDDSIPVYHAMTYTKIKYLTIVTKYDVHDTVEETNDQRQFWEQLNKDIMYYLSFSDYEYEDPDNFRIIAFESF